MISTAGRQGIATLLGLVVALMAASCAKRITKVEDGAFPEGAASASRLVVYEDEPVILTTYADLGNPGPTPDDTLLAVTEVRIAGPGVVHGFIADFTPATAFEVFRREGTGYRPLKDFLVTPALRLLDTGSELATFLDPVPQPAGSRSYVVRGVVDGAATPTSPLTNIGQPGPAGVDRGIQIRFFNYAGQPGPFPDSTMQMAWSSVPGAEGYWIQVYQLTPQSGQAIIEAGIPTPLYLGRARNYFIGYIPAPDTAYRLGNPLPAGGRVLLHRMLINGTFYTVRIAATDANGRFLADTGDNGSQVTFRTDTDYTRFASGGYDVFTQAEPPPPDERPNGAQSATTGRPLLEAGGANAWVYPRAAFRR